MSVRSPLYHGAQLAVDITMRCAVSSSGEARPGAARVDGIVHHPTRLGRPFWRGGGDGIGCCPSLAQRRSPLLCCLGAGRHAVSGADGNVPDATDLYGEA